MVQIKLVLTVNFYDVLYLIYDSKEDDSLEVF